MARRSSRPILKRGAWILALSGLAAGVVAAQPAPPQPATPPVAPTAPASEEAPPATVTAPKPAVVPPISEKDVAPAPPEKTEEETSTAAKPAGEPQRRPRYDVAILQALDKVTAETLRFEAPVGKPIRFKTLVFTVRACEKTAPDEPVEDSIAYVEILSQPKAEPGRPVLPAKQSFKGWMYASSPGLNPLEHPVYAAWLVSCRAAAPVAGAPPAAAH